MNHIGFFGGILKPIPESIRPHGLAPEEFAADILRLYAVVRCLEIISEASRRLDENLKSRHPEIDWRAVAGAGNVYRHSYERVLAKEIWKTVKLALPTLRTAVMSELSS